MTLYKFRAVTADNRPQSGELDAANASAATQTLLNRGLYPVAISPLRHSFTAMLHTPIGGQSISTAEAAQLLADLAHLVDSGVEVAEALAIMSSTAPRKTLHSLISKLSEAVRRGKPLSIALADAESAFPAHAVAVVHASEAAGSLAVGLQHIAKEMRDGNALRKQLQTALIYPSCIAVAAAVAITVLLLVVVPTLQSLFADALNRLPWQTRALVRMSQLVRSHGLLMLMIFASFVAAAVGAAKNSGCRIRGERLALRAPGIGAFVKAAETARIARLLSALTAARLPLPTIIELTVGGARLLVSRRALAGAALKLRQGASLSGSLSSVPSLSGRLLALVGIGETTGRLSAMLEEGARGAEQQVSAVIERMLAMLTPVMTVLFGIVAGFVLYAVMTAILSVNDLASMGR